MRLKDNKCFEKYCACVPHSLWPEATLLFVIAWSERPCNKKNESRWSLLPTLPEELRQARNFFPIT